MTERDELCGRTVGEFVLRERIGEGGFGAVYRCEQPLLGREAVIKVMHRRLRDDEVELQRFLREAQLASRLDHPYAAHVYAFGIEQEDGLFWIAMELVHGTPLDRWLRERGPLPIELLIPLFDRIAEVVETAHERGIIHRDLKPSNVMVIERAGRLLPKLLDFGIAKLMTPQASVAAARGEQAPRQAAATTSRAASSCTTLPYVDHRPAPVGFVPLTRTSAAIGSPPYMSPEQWSDALSVGPRSDLYALGVMAYEALTGRRPFVGSTDAEYAELHRSARAPGVGDGFPPDLDRFFRLALAKLPEDRPASALALAAELRAAVGIGASSGDLPRLEIGVRDAWLADAPQPLAEAVAVLDSARNVHQARDAAGALFHGLVRYLVAVALAARSQVRDAQDDRELGDLLRAIGRREINDEIRVRILRLVTRSFAARRGAHPMPELVEFATAHGESAPIDLVLACLASGDGGGSESTVRAQLAELVTLLGRVLRGCAFVLDYPLVVLRDGAAERWVGLRRQRRTIATVTPDQLAVDQPALLGRHGGAAVLLWPVVQVRSPAAGAELELFVFDGPGRHGARLVAAPHEFEHHDPAVWDWLGTHVLGQSEPVPAGGDERPPYLGLAPFSRDDADRFVGREREVDGCVNRLRRRALQVIVGASGAGKSSFVHAGMIPALPSGWRAVTLRPGPLPTAALVARLAAADLATADLADVLEADPHVAAAQLSRATGDGTIVIVVDQLEEIFTLCTSAGERDRFASLLAALTAREDSATRVIATIRDDFLMKLEALAPLTAVLSSSLVLLGNPSRDDLIRTMVEPAARCGYQLSDPELARDMVDEVVARPGALALLSFTASRLWEMRDRRFRQLTRNAYVAMGGVGGALGLHAEEILATLRADEQRLAPDIFRQLVTAEGTRAVLEIDELCERLGAPRTSEVIDKLVSARLLTVVDAGGAPRVEIIHEALITAWPRLQQWVRDDVEDMRRRDQLRAAAKQWDERGRPRGLLWRDDVLREAEQWRRRASQGLSGLEAAFADASLGAAARARRIRRSLLAAALVVLGGSAIVMFQLRRDARSLGALANQRLMKSYEERGQQALSAGETDAALALFSAALEIGDDRPAVRVMISRAVEPLQAEIATLRGHTGQLGGTSFSPDGARVLTAAADGTARVWAAGDGKQLVELGGHAPGMVVAAWSPDGREIATCDGAGQVRLWTAGGQLLTTLSRSPAALGSCVFHRDGMRIATASPVDGYVTIWDLARRRQLASWRADTGAMYVELDRAGERIVVAGLSGNVSLWSLDGRRLDQLTEHKDPVWYARFSPVGDRIATASLDGTARIWTPGAGSLVLRGHAGRVIHVAWSRSGDTVVTAGADRTARIWDARTGESRIVLEGHTAQLNHVELTADDAQLITAAADGTVRVWQTASGLPMAVFSHSGFVFDAAIDPAGSHLATASWTGTAKIWNLQRQPHLATLAPPPTTQATLRLAAGHALLIVDDGARSWQALDRQPRAFRHDSFVVTGDLAPDGRWFALGDADGAVTVFDADRGPITEMRFHTGPILGLAIAPSGDRIASWGTDHVIDLRDVHGGSIARREVGHAASRETASNLELLYSPLGDRLVAFDVTQPELTLLGASLELIARRAVQANAAAFAPGGRLLTGGSDRVVRVWSASGELVTALPPGRSAIAAVAASPSSPEILVGTVDGTVQVWSTRTWSLVAERRGHASVVRTLAFTSDGRFAATGGIDHFVKLWDVATLTELGTIPSDDEVVSLHIDREGRLFEFGNIAYRTQVWQLPEPYPGTPVQLARLVACRGSKTVVDGALVASESPARCD